ncbi:S26 family signal peptidase [Fodinicola feengrottensis]|uniref:S26 family signal peptidase n=1 Tax=Fodinicola feengrottensis TaxID=435914 RepID=UPI0013D5D515|nr:S26 family signal peptidase [Fodinicola feengrottensis]
MADDDPPWLIKRAVALPGDVVPAEVPHLAGARVPADRFVVLGDNSARSYDSRRVGYLHADTHCLVLSYAVCKHSGQRFVL